MKIFRFQKNLAQELGKLKDENFPAVQIYRKSPNSVISTIAIDNVDSAYQAVKYLLDLGHQRRLSWFLQGTGSEHTKAGNS